MRGGEQGHGGTETQNARKHKQKDRDRGKEGQSKRSGKLGMRVCLPLVGVFFASKLVMLRSDT